MKKNLLSFIGSILSCITIFLFGAPFMTGQGGSNTYTVSINEALGVVAPSTSSISGQFVGISGFFLIVAIIFAFMNLVIVLTNILSKKSNTSVVLAFSVVQVLAVYFIAKTISSVAAYRTSTYNYSAGWGIIIVLILFASSFVLCLVQYILDMISLRKKDEDEKYNQIYKLKKLLDDGIINQEDFDEKKAEFLKTLNKESE